MSETEIDSPPKQSRWYTPRDYALWLAGMLGVCVLGAILTQYFSWRDSRLGEREQTVTGLVTAVGRSARNGYTYDYRFSFEGRIYDGGGTGHDLWAGKSVTIYLDPNDPFTNGIDDFRLSRTWKHSYAVFLFYVSIGLALLLFFYVRRLPPNEAADSDD